ncbi:MAG: hypothetical protein ACYC3X_29405 [Pirellulaceae bacterium]
MTEQPEPKVGTMSMSGKDTSLTMRCNALAFNPKAASYEVMVLSVAGPSSTLKAAQAALNCRAKIMFQADNIPGMYSHWRMYRCNSPYRVYRHRLSYGMWHMLAVASHDGLLTESSDESLWRALQRDSVTTPMLRSWVPFIKTELTRRNLLQPLRTFGCTAALLAASCEEIDSIVTDGIWRGELRMEEAL